MLTYIHTHILAYILLYVDKCNPARMHTFMRICIHIYMITFIYAYMHTCIYAYMHTCIRTLSYTYDTYMYT